MNALDIFSAVCLIIGALSCLLGAIGLLSFPDVLARLQAATKPQTFGLIMILLGTAPHLGVGEAAGLLLVALLQMLTSPVMSQLVGRAAYRTDSVQRDTLVVDELGDAIKK